MAKRTTNQPERQPTKLTVGKEFFRQQLEQRIGIGEELLKRPIQTYDQLEKAREDYYSWNDYNSELLKQSFNNEFNEYKESYDHANFSPIIFGGQPRDEVKDFREDVDGKIGNLKQLIVKLDLLKTDVLDHSIPFDQPKSEQQSQNVFIVHGHNNEIKIEVARTIEKLGLIPIILHEQANEGKTIIEKFEKNANVGFAIVLLTDDDLGKSKNDDNLNKRARQNVIMELGYFIGKLGRNKVCPLYIKGVELPSDISGVLYIEIDSGETWKMKLVKELKACGYNVDANKII
jgi:predicted nucleotide-binding protein